MADEPDNIVLALLRKLDQRTERTADDLHDLKVRATSVEGGLAGVNRRLDRLESRFERVEMRPDYIATYGAETQQWVKASLKTASVTPPDCKLGKT